MSGAFDAQRLWLMRDGSGCGLAIRAEYSRKDMTGSCSESIDRSHAAWMHAGN
ncbi:hypothetical protein [Roseicella sp. DB1501]|uniref:hypothetical protein n=1 Tax=Roseicella sp. DB1501 TaxID=2730925 RepID=UPI001491C2D0|nr:hypothetical protein [Roseicella sp. DB1501]NOG73227.1 hypothetical protein [Roseicella sp. DB1501]